MSFSLSFDIHEIDGLAEKMHELAEADRNGLADDIGATLLASTLMRFEDEIDPDGIAWIPSQRVEELGGKTLQDKGHLRDSIDYFVSTGGDQIEIGSNLIYAAIHQFGGIAGDDANALTSIDARSYLGFNDDDKALVGDSIIEFYRRVIH